PLALDLVRQDLDLDAREVFGQLAASSLAMLAWRLLLVLGLRRCGLVVVLGGGLQQTAEHLHRQLGLVRAQLLGFLPEQALFEHAAALEHLEVQLAVAVSLLLDLLDAGGRVGVHVSFIASCDPTSRQISYATPSFLGDTGQELRELLAVDDRRRVIDNLRHDEHCAMQALVEQTIAVTVPPQDLQAIRPLVDEAEQRPGLGILTEHITSSSSETIEAA